MRSSLLRSGEWRPGLRGAGCWDRGHGGAGRVQVGASESLCTTEIRQGSVESEQIGRGEQQL